MKTLCKKYDNHGTERYKGFCQHLIFPKNLSNYYIIVRGLDKKLLSPQCFDWFILNALYIYILLTYMYKSFHQKLSRKIIFIAVCICHLFHQIYHPFCTKKCTWHTHQNSQCVRQYIYCERLPQENLGLLKYKEDLL